MMIFALGLLSQILFFLRTATQWFLSERASKVLSPSIYWVFSIMGSYLFFLYGWLRNDFAIILGQSICYYIYIWNLNKNGLWLRLHFSLKSILLATPLIAAIFVLINGQFFIEKFFSESSIPLWLILFGTIGQLVFTFRFIYQFFYSVRNNESILPFGFWLISLIGSIIILIYGFFRLDPILILGQSLSMVAYIRNLMLFYKNRHVVFNIDSNEE